MGAAGRHIPDPGFAGDTGRADEALVAALAARANGGAEDHDVLALLLTARVLVPVVAVLVEDTTDAGVLRREKATDMALVTLVGRDGRRALPVFTSLATLAAWRPDARPVPVEAPRAALSAVAEGATVLIVDVARPHRFEISGAALDALARGRAWVPPHADPEVREAIRAAVEVQPVITAARIGAGGNGLVRVELVHAPRADVAEVRAAAGAVATRLAAADIIRDRARDGLDLVVVPSG